MDNITHTLTGAALGAAGLRRLTPLATATLVLAANAPDVDILSYLNGEYAALAFRRGWTHGIPALLVWPFIVAGVVLAYDRLVRRRRRPDAEPARAGPLALLALIGVATHPALDWLNTYGMRWLVPIDRSWSYGDAVFIVDPWLWLLLGGGVVIGYATSRLRLGGWILLGALMSWLVLGTGVVPPAARLVWIAGIVLIAAARALGSATFRARRREHLARGAAALAVTYIVAMIAMDGAARRDVARQLGERQAVLDLMIAPAPANPFAAGVVIVTADGYQFGEHHWLRRERFVLEPAAVPNTAGPAGLGRATLETILARARRDPRVRDFLVWSRYPFFHVADAGGAYDVRIGDARYSRRGGGSLGGLVVSVPYADVNPTTGESQ
ncbi:MAG: metal-dependent hydrolase [Longimicrobiales bacterium]